MGKIYLPVLIILIFTANAGLFAQNREFAPFVTNINVEARNNLIRLTWADSPDVRGPVYIFRSVRPFGGSIPANIRPVVVRYGEQFYIDDTDDMQNLYYFIAASDTAGQRFDVILPRINSTSLIITQSGDEFPSQVLVTPPDEIDPIETADGIYSLKANQNEDGVIITFETAGPQRNAILYRSTQPMRQPQDLLNAVIVRSRVTSPFIDYPVPGLTWYYAVIFEDEIATGSMGIKPGINSTTRPVSISGMIAERSLRPIPLPVMTLNNTMPDGFFLTEIPGQTPLSAQSINIIRDNQMPVKAELVLKRPRVFAVDLVAPTGGEESALFQIVTEYFVKYDWENARTSLQHYLSLPRSREIEARARFYLGQALYFNGSYRLALMEFLSFRAFHLPEANVWIEAVLTAMVH